MRSSSLSPFLFSFYWSDKPIELPSSLRDPSFVGNLQQSSSDAWKDGNRFSAMGGLRLVVGGAICAWSRPVVSVNGHLFSGRTMEEWQHSANSRGRTRARFLHDYPNPLVALTELCRCKLSIVVLCSHKQQPGEDSW